jgi:hypothetical protein
MKKTKPTRKDKKAMEAREEMERYLKLKKYTRESLDKDIARWSANMRFLKERNKQLP